MTYEDALAFWHGRINYEVRAAKPGDLKLERMRALLRLLGDPHDRLRLVHVTGTKGKGSTSAMLATVLRAAGYRVGLFTSPHLTDVRERIQIDGEPISREELTARMEEVAAAVRHMDGSSWPPPTFFEIGTALGFLHFRYRRCDVSVIEVGLGGRFDSTNVCRPVVSVVTNVGLDHTAQLGNTLEAIAFEKAGIVKRGVPAVSGVTQPGPREVVRRIAEERNAPLVEPLREPAGPPWYAVGLPGPHQRENARIAVATAECLRAAGLTIPDAAVQVGLFHVRWPGRVELVSRHPTVILDTAHNVPSVEALVQTLAESFPVPGRKAVVFAVSSDKQFPEMLRVLAGHFDRFHLCKYGTNPRCAPPERLAEVLAAVAPGTPAAVHATSSEAWATAYSAAAPDDLLCVTGSVFLAGELRPVLVALEPIGR